MVLKENGLNICKDLFDMIWIFFLFELFGVLF